MKKVFLDGLPRRGKLIDWKNSVGHTVPFIYDELEGEVYIEGYHNRKLDIRYLDYNVHTMYTGALVQIGGNDEYVALCNEHYYKGQLN